MPKRQLSVQNKGNENEQQTSTIVTRLSLKRVNINEEVSRKKVKIEEEHDNKENIPKRETRQSKKSKEPPIRPATIVEKKVTKEIDEESEQEQEEEEVEEEDYPISTKDNDNKYKDHPTNKQYVIYENDDSNNEPFVISKTAQYWTLRYRKALSHVNPDAYGIYIHNDFACYGALEVVENCLLDLTKTIFVVQQGFFLRENLQPKPTEKVNYLLGFRRLEALTILLDFADEISGIDDGERFGELIRVIGACYVTILRGLFPSEMFKKMEKISENLNKKLRKFSKQIPNLKQVLQRAIIVGHLFVTIGDLCSAYTNILQIVYSNWILFFDKKKLNFNDKSNEKLSQALKHAASITQNDVENNVKETFDFLKELRFYKQRYGLGGDFHDLSKWPRHQLDQYKYERLSNRFLF